MTYLGAFAGTDALIAVVPIGVLFAKKLKLDPIVAMGVTTFATMIGFGTGPTKMFIPQMLMDVPVFSGFGARFISMNFFMVVGLLFLLRYIKKIEKDPTKSTMGNTDWLKNDEEFDASELEKEQLERDTHLTWRRIIIIRNAVCNYILCNKRRSIKSFSSNDRSKCSRRITNGSNIRDGHRWNSCLFR
jgi:uncharacterized ion transporter superfamily protein YfcC